MPDFSVIQVGTDSSGREIFHTVFYDQVFRAVLRQPRVAPFADKVTIVQGAHMLRVPGGGAEDSKGYHDHGGTDDIRTWNLTLKEQRILWWEFAQAGVIVWPRGTAAFMGGMDPHAHAAAGWDEPIAPGIADQWQDAMPPDRGSGLDSGGPDYVKPRPEWVDFPPDELFEEDYMASDDAKEKLDEALKLLRGLDRGLDNFRTIEQKRDRAAAEKAKRVAARQIAALGGINDRLISLSNSTSDDATKEQVRALQRFVQTHLTDDPDVDGRDNPVQPGEDDE